MSGESTKVFIGQPFTSPILIPQLYMFISSLALCFKDDLKNKFFSASSIGKEDFPVTF